MDLSKYTLEQLKQEIERREKKKIEKPKFLTNEKIIEQFQEVKEFLNNNIDSKINEIGYTEKDFEHYSFETLLELFYGTKIWKWYNENNT